MPIPEIRGAARVPYSSISGQSIALHDEAGAVICQLSVRGVRLDLMTMDQGLREVSEALAEEVAQLLMQGISLDVLGVP